MVRAACLQSQAGVLVQLTHILCPSSYLFNDLSVCLSIHPSIPTLNSSKQTQGRAQLWVQSSPWAEPPPPGASIPTQQPPVGALSWPQPTGGVFTQYIPFFPVFVLTLLQARWCPSCTELRAAGCRWLPALLGLPGVTPPGPGAAIPAPSSLAGTTRPCLWALHHSWCCSSLRNHGELGSSGRKNEQLLVLALSPALSQLCQGAAQSHRAPPGRRAKYVKSPDGGRKDYELQNLSRVLAKTQAWPQRRRDPRRVLS